ncbi:Uncharacterised protein [Mycobacteroides abscessus subsp. abscessus]|uniref:hypothetical protein n=1 Tax=Mycobacteroides abscessus TaxID=36809 RepID=UPI0009CB9F1D|nr:hypothetical protein [Mycobacteroides abscessus]SKO34032.1 Uncharacterised protein [Mycobacteroides abscessus subsp. abscessus]
MYSEHVSSMKMVKREDDGTPLRAGMIVDRIGSADAPKADTRDPFLDSLIRSGWALLADIEQDSPLVDTYHLEIGDDESLQIVGPNVLFANLPLTDNSWPDVSWVDLATKHGVVEVLIGKIGLGSGSAGDVLRHAISRNEVVGGCLSLKTGRGVSPCNRS